MRLLRGESPTTTTKTKPLGNNNPDNNNHKQRVRRTVLNRKCSLPSRRCHARHPNLNGGAAGHPNEPRAPGVARTRVPITVAVDDRQAHDWEAMQIDADTTTACIDQACLTISGENPSAGPKRFGDLRRILARPHSKPHPLSELGMAATTRGEHMRLLGWLQHQPGFDAWPTHQAIMEIFSRRRREKRLKWSTAIKHLASVAGALQLLPLYRTGATPIALHLVPEWKMALRGVAAKSKEEGARTPMAASYEHVRRAVNAATHVGTKRALATTWLLAARTGDVLKLRSREITVGTNHDLTATYTKGKTVMRRGPYSVSSTIPAEWEQLFRQLPENPFAGASTWTVLAALRSVDKRLENRSLRRGALQTMAKSGLEEETLLLFSGHASVAMLRRYLNWGRDTHVNVRKMQTAAQVLVRA